MSKIKYTGGLVYSTNANLLSNTTDNENSDTLDKAKQKLKVIKDSKKRAGKTVTLVNNFVGTDDDLQDLCKLLKTKCGCGGSAKDGQIIIQGDVVTKLITLLQKEGYGAK
jgi:translation initiation factor 1